MTEKMKFIKDLTNKPFLAILGKYDHIIGPRALFSSPEIQDQDFIDRVVRDALHTKSKYIILDFGDIYAQGAKVEIEDLNARGRKQLYVIIILRVSALPQIPIIHFKRMEMLFHKIGKDIILLDDESVFHIYFDEIDKIYRDKHEILPLESLNLQIRSGINTIQGFCELILEEKKHKGIIDPNDVLTYVQLMLESCNEIITALDENFT